MADFTVTGEIDASGMSKGEKKAVEALNNVEKKAKAAAASIAASSEQIGSSTEKGLSKAAKSLDIWNKRLEIARTNLVKAQESGLARITVSKEATTRQEGVNQASASRLSATLADRKTTDDRRLQYAKNLVDYRSYNRQLNKLDDDRESHFRKVQAAMRKADNQRIATFNQGVKQEANLLARVIKRTAGSPLDFQTAVKESVSGYGAAVHRQGLMAQGMSLEEAFIEQLQDRVGGISASALVSGGRKTNAMKGTVAGGGGGGGGIGGIIRRLLGGGGGGIAGSLVGGLASGIGIGVGGYALANAGQALIDSTKQATAYERQMKAAEGLADGQGKLNALLKEYNKDSGGAVSKTDQLAAVTRLLATGFAKTAQEVGKFTRGSRGASIALGRPQEEVTQDIQLAISNTSKKRLDQIGLGIKEVDDRIEHLRKTNKGWQREQAFGEAVLQLLDEKYGKLSKTAEGQATGLERLASAWDDLTLAMGKNAKSPVNKIAGGFADFLTGKTETKGYNPFRSGDIVDEFAVRLLNPFRNISVGQYNAEQMLERGGGRGSRYGAGGGPGIPGPIQPRFNEQQYPVISQAYDAIAKMEKDFDKQREDETRNFNESIANMEKNYNKSRLREEQDFARSQARATRDYNKSVSDAIADAKDRDEQSTKDLNRTIAKYREDSDKAIAKNEKQYRDDEEKAAKQHRLAMLKSAGQLDAIAILDERISYREDQKERKKQHAEQIADAKEALADQIKDANEAAAERLDQAHKEDKKHLDDMAFNRKQQIDDEAEDRGIALARAKEDHDDEIAEATRVHNAKMEQIATEEEDRRTELNDALEADLTSVGIYVKGYQEKLEARDKKMEEWFDKYLDKMEKAIGIENQIPKGENATRLGPSIPQYAAGGYVPRTGIAMLHAGEFVMPRAQVAATGTGGNSRMLQIHQGAFQISTTPGYERAVAEQIEEILVKLLEEI